MDKLPIEIHCIIVGFVDVPTLLTCRLVCRAWNKFVETTLAKVTHVKINQSAIDDSPIPNILLGSLYEKRFVCHDAVKLSALHTFIADKCPNLKAYSSISYPIKSADIFKLPNGLLYFEIRYSVRLSDSVTHFPLLIACDAEFCTSCHLNSMIQYSDICRDPYNIRSEHPSLNKFTAEKLQALKWYDHLDKKEEEVTRLPACPSLEILRCNFYHNRGKNIHPFSYPNLKYFKCEHLGEDLQPLLSSLEHSAHLRAIEIENVQNGSSFLNFIATLEHLEYLKLTWLHTAEDIIEFVLNDSLTYVSVMTEKPFVITNKHHENLKILRLRCQHEQLQLFRLRCTQPNRKLPIECTFPSLRQAYFDLPYTEDTTQLINSLRSSKGLKRLEMKFSAYFKNEQACEIIRLPGELIQLEYVSISLQLDTDITQPREPIVFDISRHQNLEEVRFKFSFYNSNPLFVKMAVGGSDYDHLCLYKGQFELKKRGVYRRKCIINYRFLDLLPCNEEEPGREFFSFEKLEVTLEHSTSSEEIEQFTKLMSQMKRLKHLTVSTQSWDIPLEQAKFYWNEIAKVVSLESLEMNLSIEASANGRSEENIIIDARQLSSLRKLIIKLSADGVELRHVQLSLLLGDFYKELVFVDENTLEGQLVTGEKMKFVMPKYSEVDFTGPMDQLRSLSITEWNMVKDTSGLFEACKSIDSLHMNKADHIRSLIPTLAQLEHLNRLSGQLSHTFLRMFLTRFKQPRVLNVHSSLKPIVEKIQEKSKTAHSQICFLDSRETHDDS